MTPKYIYSTKVIIVCGIAIILILFVNYFLSSPSSEARVARVRPGFFEPIEGRRVLPHFSAQSSLRSFEVTAYCPCEICCGRWADGYTASGLPAEGWLLAAPSEIPFGTLLVIPGYADGLPVPVLDRGPKDNKLEVFFPTHQEALEWGRQQLKVKFEGAVLAKDGRLEK